MQHDVIEGFRLSPQQQRVWRLRDGGAAGTAQCVLALAGDLRAAALEQALSAVVGRHEILRTRFERLPGMEMPIQVIAGEPILAFHEVALDGGSQALESLLEQERSITECDRGRFALASTVKGYLLVMTLPALLADSRSLDNLSAEVARAYGAALHSAEKPGEPLQYVQFSEWQNEVLEDAGAGDAREFWHRQLLADSGPSDLSLDATGISERRASYPVSLVRVVCAPLEGTACDAERVAREWGASVEALLLTCWGGLLARHSGSSEVAVEVLFDGRKFGELAAALGPFGRFLPVGLRGLDDRSFARALGQVEDTLVEAFGWQELCPGRTMEEPRIPGFAWEESVAGPWTCGGVTFSILDKLYAGGDSALILWARRYGDDLALELHGDPAIYTHEALRLLASRLMVLLESAVRHPQMPGNELEWIGPEEGRRLEAWSLRPLPAVAEPVLTRAFAAQAARTQEAAAMTAGGETLTFHELRRRSGELCRRLRRLGVGPESRVALYLDRSVDAVAALLAVLEAGGAYVPIDAGQTGQRLAWILDDAVVEAVVTQSSLAAALPPGRLRRLLVDAPEAGDEAEDVPVAPAAPWSCAYVLYTSGSTGHPKGTLIENRSVACLSAALAAAVYADFEDGSPLRVAVNAPLSFDASVKQVVQLLRGHSLWLVPEEVRGDGEAFLAWLRETQVDVVDCTPSHLQLLLDAGLADGDSPFPRILLVGGEAIRPDLWRQIAADRSRRFYNLYGPTECTVDATVCRVGPGTGPTLGRPLPGVAVHVLDGRLRRVPIGVAEELCLGGPQLSRGYLGRPDLTAERFVPNPFAATPGDRLYRTGDRARWLPDGRLEFLGRLDRQVKVRGVRVEPGEIEAVLRESPMVRDALVVLREDQPGDQRLVAYAVPRRRAGVVSSLGRPRHELPNGMAIVHQNRNETDYLYEEIFAKRCYLQHGVRLPAGACVVDVGANIGMFTLFVHQQCARPRVFAFEPIPAIFEALRANCELYAPETRLFAYGLSDAERDESFTFYPRYTMMSGQSRHARPESEAEVVKRYLENLWQEGREGAEALLGDADELLAGRFQGEVVTSRLRRLSQVLQEERIAHVDLLKVDVQRAEVEVLRGLDEEDWERIDQIVLEVHEAPGTDSEDRVGEVLALLDRHGFQAVAEQDQLLRGTDRYNVYAVSRRLDRDDEIEESQRPLNVVTPVAADLRQFLKSRLPDILVPASVVWLYEIPLTRNGKVDFAALPPPNGGAPAREAAPPHTPYEEVLTGLWAEVLGVEKVGVDQSFFELGGHSLLATQLMSRARGAFGVELPLRALFEEPTVSGLAARIELALRAGHGVEKPPIVPVPRGGDLPLSFAQQRFWFLHQLDPDSPAYNSPKAVRLDGRLEETILERTLEEVVRRHEVLRTTFPAVDGCAEQRIAPADRFLLPVVDLTGLAGPVREAEGTHLADDEARRPFDLAHGPVLRATLLRQGAEEHILLFTMHHIVSDAWSLGVLVREVATLYSAFREGRPSPLPDLPVQYADVSHWQRRWLSGEILERELAYWRRQIGPEPPVLDLPTDRPRPPASVFQGGRETFRLAEDLSAGLRELSRQEGATLFMTLLAGFQALLARYSGQNRILVGVPIAGRNRRETEDLIGCFLNMLVLVADFSGRPSFRELLAQVRRASLEAYAHQDLPFERLVEELAPERGTGHSPLFQVNFGLQNAPRQSFDLPGLRMHAAGGQFESSRYDLTLWLYEGRDSLTVIWTYSASLFDAATVYRMHRQFEALLREAVARPEEPLDILEVFTDDEKSELERSKRDLKDANWRRFLNTRSRISAEAGMPR